MQNNVTVVDPTKIDFTGVPTSDLILVIQSNLSDMMTSISDAKISLDEDNWNKESEIISTLSIASKKLPSINKVIDGTKWDNFWNAVFFKSKQSIYSERREDSYEILKNFYAILSTQEEKLMNTMVMISDKQANLHKQVNILSDFLEKLKFDAEKETDDNRIAVYNKFIAYISSMEILKIGLDKKYDLNVVEISSLMSDMSLRKVTFFDLIKSYLNKKFVNNQIEEAADTVNQMDDSINRLMKETDAQDLRNADKVSKIAAGTPIKEDTISGMIKSYTDSIEKIAENLKNGNENNKQLISLIEINKPLFEKEVGELVSEEMKKLK